MTNELLAALEKENFASPDERPLTVRDSSQISWCEFADRVSFGRAKADSPSPCNRPKYPISEIGSRNIPRVMQTGDGECLDCESTTVPLIGGRTHRSGGSGIATEGVYGAPNLPSRKTVRKLKQFCGNGFMPEMTTC